MNSVKTSYIISFLAIAFLSYSCKKEGCSDAAAFNYDKSAKKDDGSCIYQGEVVFWYDENTSESLQLNGASSLTYYFNGELVGSTATNVYWSGSPECGQNASITVTKNNMTSRSQNFTYLIKDQLGIERWTDEINLKANKCTSLELEY